MSVNTCLETVVGLSSNDCACFETDRPAGYNTSLSGYYIDDPEYGFPLKIPQSIQECGVSDMWGIIERARDAGITQFVTDLGAGILSGPFMRKVAPFNGWIGKDAHNMNLSGFGAVVGIKICPKIFMGTIAKTYQMELYIAGRNGDTITVSFYNTAGLTSGTALGTAAMVISNSKGVLTLPTEIVHDFMNDYSQREPLYILYSPGVGTPRNNTIRCATCGGKDPWQKYFDISGVTGADLAAIRDLPLATNSDCALSTSSGYSYGIRVNMGVSCGHTWLCQNFDYDNDVWARVMAECIALYGIKKLAGIILNEPGPNKYTQLNREEVAFHRDRAGKQLEQRMPWLCENVPDTATDCFECNERISRVEYMV